MPVKSRSGSLATRLRALREEAGISARQLSQLASINVSHVSLIENGSVVVPSAQTIKQIALVLGATMDWLFAGIGEPPSSDEIASAVARCRRKRTGTDDS